MTPHEDDMKEKPASAAFCLHPRPKASIHPIPPKTKKALQLTLKGFSFSREDRIRTCDPLVPNQVRYRPALLPDCLCKAKTKLPNQQKVIKSGEGGIRTRGTV